MYQLCGDGLTSRKNWWLEPEGGQLEDLHPLHFCSCSQMGWARPEAHKEKTRGVSCWFQPQAVVGLQSFQGRVGKIKSSGSSLNSSQ